MNYYIQGNSDKSAEIKAAFEKLGVASNADKYNYKNNYVLYFTAGGMMHMIDADSSWANIIKTHPDYKELELPIKPQFKVGDWIACNADSFTLFIKSVRDENYYFHQGTSLPIKHIDEHYHLWTIEDAKDGDVICTPNNNLFIYKCKGSGAKIYDYCGLYHGKFEPDSSSPNGAYNSCDGYVPATKEQRDMFFAKMKEAGYEWDEKKKELCKIIVPKFKVGDSLQTGSYFTKILSINLEEERYYCDNRIISFENQDLWHLVPKPHYDIANFKPKQWVLCRDYGECEWALTRFSHLLTSGSAFLFACINGATFHQCIPFEGNEHLLGTTDMCDEMYINW